MRCLVIDDSADDRSLVERMLKRSGYRATYCASGHEAIEVLQKQRFDIAMVDLGMAAMPGEEVIRAIRKIDPLMRVMVVSSFDDRAHVLEALDAGAQGYVLKYELSQKLSPALQDLMAGRSPMSAAVSGILLKKLKERLAETVPPPKSAEGTGPLRVGVPEAAGQPIGKIELKVGDSSVTVDRSGEIESPGTLPKTCS